MDVSRVIAPGMTVWVKAKSITALEMGRHQRSDLFRGTVRYVGRRQAAVDIPLEKGTICESFFYEDIIFENGDEETSANSMNLHQKKKRPGKKGAMLDGH